MGFYLCAGLGCGPFSHRIALVFFVFAGCDYCLRRNLCNAHGCLVVTLIYWLCRGGGPQPQFPTNFIENSIKTESRKESNIYYKYEWRNECNDIRPIVLSQLNGSIVEVAAHLDFHCAPINASGSAEIQCLPPRIDCIQFIRLFCSSMIGPLDRGIQMLFQIRWYGRGKQANGNGCGEHRLGDFGQMETYALVVRQKRSTDWQASFNDSTCKHHYHVHCSEWIKIKIFKSIHESVYLSKCHLTFAYWHACKLTHTHAQIAHTHTHTQPNWTHAHIGTHSARWFTGKSRTSQIKGEPHHT